MSFESLVSEAENEPLLRPVMPELDTIRGLAILMVVVYHGFYWQVDQTGLPDIVRLLLTATWTGRFGVNLFLFCRDF
jgi:peptidoglycan/LPS O-acetylase OafA/YrhL